MCQLRNSRESSPRSIVIMLFRNLIIQLYSHLNFIKCAEFYEDSPNERAVKWSNCQTTRFSLCLVSDLVGQTLLCLFGLTDSVQLNSTVLIHISDIHIIVLFLNGTNSMNS